MQEQSPFQNIFNIIGGLSEGNEKPMKHGFYNAFALFILAISCAAVYVLFLILEPFFKPLFWALLVGSLLHPFKYKLSKKLKAWFEDLDKSDASLVYGLCTIPINLINNTAELVGYEFQEHYKVVICIVSSVYVVPWLYNSVPKTFSCLFWHLCNIGSVSVTMIMNLCSFYITATITIAYSISVYMLWTPERMVLFKFMSQGFWLVITSFLASMMGSFKVYTFLILQAICIAGFILQVLEAHQNLLEKDPEATITAAIYNVMMNELSEDINNDTCQVKESNPSSGDELTNQPKDAAASTPSDTLEKQKSWPGGIEQSSSPRAARKLLKTRTLSYIPLPKMKSPFENRLLSSFRQRSLDESCMKSHFDSEDETTFYFKILFFGCFCMLVWKHMWLLPVMLFFFAIYMLKKILEFFGVRLFVRKQCDGIINKVRCWWRDRESSIILPHIKGVAQLLAVGNRKLREVAYDSVDTVSTCIVITGLILFAIVATVFICIQVYSEAIVVIQLSGSLLNSTFVQNSELHAYLPDGWEEKLDSLIDNAYTYGREGISMGIKSILKEGDPEKVARVEQQIVEVWDRVYQSWVSGHFAAPVGPHVSSDAVTDSWDKFLNDISMMPGLFDYSGVVVWVRANVGTLLSIASSIWAPLASNMSLLAGSLGAITSLLLCGGGAIINLFINLVVFFTTLFYLLASSSALYKPIEMITQLQPNLGPKLGLALSVAINQVFRASFKMALFYGLWTWLVHNLFGAKVVYLPSLVAGVLGAAPFLGAYLAALPAALDVWLQGRAAAALLLLAAQAAPIAFLDAAVYAEIKDGGHPYLTGLAIAGGIYYLGPAGAILGPLLLCCIMVAFHLSSAFLRDSPAEERAALQSRVRLGAYL